MDSKRYLLMENPHGSGFQSLLELMQKDCTFDVQIRQHRKKRSLTANAYAWALLDQIAKRVGEKKEDVYREEIRNVGGNSVSVSLESPAAKMLCDRWSGFGKGWVTDTLSDDGETADIILYYGSSTFDSEQMSSFLNIIIQDCQALGIETDPQMARLLAQEWRPV